MSSENNIPAQDTLLTIVEPAWGSQLASIILELEQLRARKLGGPLPAHVFFQIKSIFHMLESLGSARIEGNRTTLAAFVEHVIEQRQAPRTEDEKIREVANIEDALDFIETNVQAGTEISRALCSEIHQIVVKELPTGSGGEGSRTPGVYRTVPVVINHADHTPPEPVRVPELMEELFAFVNKPVESKYDLLVTALSHHRFAWIHPFDNGNGRVVRMFTYAMLIKQGFRVGDGRLINPTAIFCADRNKYYDMLALADTGTPEVRLSWCEYVLSGLRDEIHKVDRLLDYQFMVEKILLPALSDAREHAYITEREHRILERTIHNDSMTIKSADIEAVIGESSPVMRSRIIAGLRQKGMLVPMTENGRIYYVEFYNNYLLRSVIRVLERAGFVPPSLNNNN